MPKEIVPSSRRAWPRVRAGRHPVQLFQADRPPRPGQNLYPIFFFKAKNGDLGYAPSATGSGEMEASVNVFFQFLQETATGTLEPMISGRTPSVLKTDGAGYSPDNEDWYSFGMTLPAGKFTLAMVLASQDMKKMSVAYTDVTLPGPETYAATLWPTAP